MFSIGLKPIIILSRESNPRRALSLLATKICRTNFIPMISCRGFHEDTGELICPNMIRGIDHLRDPRLNKGLAFTIQERQQLGIHGLLPAQVTSTEEQVEHCRIAVDRFENFLNKYIYLADLQDRNERLFFRLLSTDVEKYLPILYTPTVGLACQRFGLIFRRPRGLFITIQDKGHVLSVLKNWPENDVRAIVFTDGERILGLGDLGAYGMGIPVGKLALYTALAGIKPHQCLPITLDVGCNNEELLQDPLYIGLRRKRVTGKEYSEFLDEFMEACVERYGPNILLQFEDFALANAAPLLAKYRDRYCTFNDDIQGTAAVSVAGLIAATRITKRKMSENIYLYLGAGSASNGIAQLSVMAMMEEGLSEKDAQSKIFMFDIDGLLTSKRKGGVPELAKAFGKDIEPETSLEAAVTKLKATCLIGASTVGGAFTPKIIQQMAKNIEIPIIFALSNPTSKAECSAQDAYEHTNGKVVYASGSPFPPVHFNGKTYVTGQGNNSYIFPGVALGVIATETHHIDDSMFLCAARTLAQIVAESDIAMGRIYPPLSEVNEVSLVIAIEVAKLAYKEGVAGKFPKPKDDQLMKDLIINAKYDINYKRFGTEVYDWPQVSPEILAKVKSFDKVAEKYGVKMDGKPLDETRVQKRSTEIKTVKVKTKEHRVRRKQKQAKKIRAEFMEQLKGKNKPQNTEKPQKPKKPQKPQKPQKSESK